MSFLNAVSNIMPDLIMPPLFILGIFITVKLGFPQVLKLPFIIKNTAGTLLKKDDTRNKKNISSFQAVTTALAGTMGVGNIAGVATALAAGGPGAIFWMWVSAFFGMAVKYSEIYLAAIYRRKDKKGRFFGGPMYYMESGLGSKGIARVFAAFCVLSSFGIGNMAQVNSVSTAAFSVFSIPLWVSGVICAVIVALVIFGGVRRIARINEMAIPFISIIYLCFSIAFLYINRSYLSDAFSLIFSEAFGASGIAGGVLGYSVSTAIRLGLTRGVFTNEAGLGSAPIAHAAADFKSPAHQGAWGIFEVFLDTIVVCTITALVILTAGGGMLWHSGIDGAPLTSAAFASVFGGMGENFIALSLFLFAVPSMLGWCYYGESALTYLCGNKKGPISAYRLIFCACAVIGAVGGLKAVWAASDILNSLMVAPNIIAIFLLRKQIKPPR